MNQLQAKVFPRSEACASLPPSLLPSLSFQEGRNSRGKSTGKGQEGTKEQKSDVLVLQKIASTPTPIISNFISLLSMCLMTPTLV